MGNGILTSTITTSNIIQDTTKNIDWDNLQLEGKSTAEIDDLLKLINDDSTLSNDYKNSIINKLLDKRNELREIEERKHHEEEETRQTINSEKEQQKAADFDQVNELKKLLLEKDEKIDSMQNEIDSLREELRKISDKNHDALVSLKEGKKSGDQEVIKKQKEMILKLIQEKKALRDKYAGELPKYEGDINTLETKRIELKLFGNKSVDGQKVLTGPQLKFRQNLRSRKRINTTVKRLNEIGRDPKEGVNFVLTRTFGYDPLNVSGKVGTGFKNIRKFFKIRDVNAFDEMYNKQKKYFIEDLESKMAANSMSEKDKKVIAAIKNRLDYYQAAYKKTFIRV